jgi:non-ribosomal peptide synthetase component E (peptide arylation enzyme)
MLVVPALIHGISEVPEEELTNYDLSSFKKMYWGGNSLPREFQLIFTEKFNCESYQVYGMAEGLICWTKSSDSLEVKLLTQGQPVSEADEVKVVDVETGLEVPTGMVGECQVRGPYTLRGYYKAEEHNKNAFTHDGFYRTGDLIKKDELGNIIVLGRIKDCISRGSEKINAEEVENYMNEFPKVQKVAIVAMPDKVMGERVCAFVVLVPGQIFTLEELSDFLLNIKRIAKYKVPDKLEFVDEIPLTKIGKYEKKSLRERIKMILKFEGKFYGEDESVNPGC